MTWVLGIEDTCVYPSDGSLSELDEHVLTEHHLNWKDDLLQVRELGATAVRYGMSWPLVHTAPGVFDWAVLDEVVDYAVDELGLTIIADLVHYGTPTWLTDSFADADYPEAVESFASELATRYQGRIEHFTPLNEPVTTASFCGLRGVWPPSLTGWEGWTAVAVPISVGMARASQAIRAANPQAQIVHVEASTVMTTNLPELEDHRALLEMVGWLPADLMMGRVLPDDSRWAWLVEHGARETQLRWLIDNPAIPDIMGVNYYPDLTPRTLQVIEGNPTQIAYNGWTKGLRSAVTAFSKRYELPIAITETSIEGADDVREAWLRDSAVEALAMAQEGIDLRGYTWWPLLDFVDWSWASNGQNVEEFAVISVLSDGSTHVSHAAPLGTPAGGKTPFLRRMGLVRLEEAFDGSLERLTTGAAHMFLEQAGQEVP